MPSNERNYGIDSLRVVSMLMIVMLHVLGVGGVIAKSSWMSANYFATWTVENLIYCAVNCYALISGFVGVYSRFKLKSIVSLWFQVEFYSLGIAVLLFFLFPGVFSVRDVVKSGLPVLFEQYWYFSAYFCMFFFMPFMNRFVLEFPKDLVRKFLAVAFVMFSLLPTLVDEDVFHTMNGYSALWLGLMYILGGFIRHYGVWQGLRKSFYLKVFAAVMACNLVVMFGTNLIWMRLKGEAFYHANILMEYTSPTVVVASVMLLILFSKIRWGRTGTVLVKFFAPLAFGVYLVHMQPMIWTCLGETPFAWISQYPVYAAIPMLLGVVSGIYVTSSIIEFIRKNLFKILGICSLETLISEKMEVLGQRLLSFFKI